MNERERSRSQLRGQGLRSAGVAVTSQATNQLERVSKEIKRRTKVVEVFWGEEAVEKLLYLVLSNLNERLEGRRLRGFAETLMGSYHVAQTQ